MDNLEPSNKNIRRIDKRSETPDFYKTISDMRVREIENYIKSSIYLNTERALFIPKVSNKDLQSAYEDCCDAIIMFEESQRDDLTKEFKFLELIIKFIKNNDFEESLEPINLTIKDPRFKEILPLLHFLRGIILFNSKTPNYEKVIRSFNISDRLQTNNELLLLLRGLSFRYLHKYHVEHQI